MYDRRKDYTKKKWLELQKQNRATNGFNTGIRDIASKKYPIREQRKKFDRKEIADYEF